MIDQFAIKTKIKLVDYKTYENRSYLIAKVMQGKHVVVGGSENLESITQFMNKRYLIPFHLSKQKAFLAFGAIAIEKSLSEQMTKQINKM